MFLYWLIPALCHMATSRNTPFVQIASPLIYLPYFLFIINPRRIRSCIRLLISPTLSYPSPMLFPPSSLYDAWLPHCFFRVYSSSRILFYTLSVTGVAFSRLVFHPLCIWYCLIIITLIRGLHPDFCCWPKMIWTLANNSNNDCLFELPWPTTDMNLRNP